MKPTWSLIRSSQTDDDNLDINERDSAKYFSLSYSRVFIYSLCLLSKYVDAFSITHFSSSSWSECTCDRGCGVHWYVSLTISFLFFLSLNPGSHVVYVLQKTRRYKVISLDNNHNSSSAALDRVSELSKSELPANASDQERESTEIDSHKCDLTKSEEIRAVFEKYGKGGIWGVIHIAVSFNATCQAFSLNTFNYRPIKQSVNRQKSPLLIMPTTSALPYPSCKSWASMIVITSYIHPLLLSMEHLLSFPFPKQRDCKLTARMERPK